MAKQIKLKSLLKEGYAWERKPGKPLPTIQEVMDEFQASQKSKIPAVPVKEAIPSATSLDLRKIDNVEVDYDSSDYPDFADAYVISADYDGKEMTPEQLEILNNGNYADFIHNEVFNQLYEGAKQSTKHFKNPVKVSKLSLKETLELQKTARIITESQYKKLLNEDESKNDVISKIPDMVSKIEEMPEFDKMVSQISKSPKATKQLMDVLKSYGISPESLNEGVESAAEKLAATFIDKAEDKFKDAEKVVTESNDMSGTFGLWLAGLVGGGALGTYISSKFGIFAHAGADLFGNMQNVPEWWVMPAAALAASLLAALGNEVYKAVKGND